MESCWLFYTCVPVLIGSPGDVGRVARRIYTAHRLTPVWFGSGFSLAAHAYTERHPLRVSRLSDPLILDALKSFATAPEQIGKLLALIPCSPDAAAFVARTAASLESAFVLLPMPDGTSDPLAGLIRTQNAYPTESEVTVP